MGMLAKIRRMHFRDHLPLREIARQTGMARNTVRQWLRQKDIVEPRVQEAGSPNDRFFVRWHLTDVPEIVVNSLITNIKDGQHFPLGAPVVKGIAWDAGYGINLVEVSTDGGKSWQDATLEKDHGRFSFHPWQFSFRPHKPGKYVVMAKASNRQGATQTFELIFNPAGYHNNVVQRIGIQVA